MAGRARAGGSALTPPPPHRRCGDKYNGVVVWKALPRKVVCDEIIYREAGSFALNVYTYERTAGEELELALSTQKKYTRNLIWIAHEMYGKDPEYAAFFSCLDVGARSWLSAMEANVEFAMTKAAAAKGETVASSSIPLYPKQVARITMAYAIAASMGGTGSVKAIFSKTVRGAARGP